MARGLTPKQLAFVNEYSVDFNATEAAIRAGYNRRSAHVQGQQLLANPYVCQALAIRQIKKAETSDITAEKTLCELAVLAFSDIRHYALDANYNIKLAEGAPDHAMRAVKSVKHRIRPVIIDGAHVGDNHEIEYALWDKNTALTNLAKHFRLLIDRFEITAP